MKVNDRVLKKSEYLKSYFKGRYFQLMKRVTKISGIKIEPKDYNGNPILNHKDAYSIIKNLILNEKSFMAGRFGASEGNAFFRYMQIKMGLKQSFGKRLDVMCHNAGFFPYDEQKLFDYCELMSDLYGEVDLLGVMRCLGEDFIIKNYCPNVQLTRLGVLDPHAEWTTALEGRRVLVIHPMASTINTQYLNNRLNLYEDTGILPDFSLDTIKAVQTIAGQRDPRFSSWFEALDWMTEEIEKKSFDIALVGAGAYGFPLAARIKRLGRQSVHMGGCLQMMFGILGKRWEQNPYYLKYINEHWVKPTNEETPIGAMTIENGCYW